MAGADTKIIYSSYSGAGAATVVKSYFNLGLQQPLIINYANLSTAFVTRQGHASAAPDGNQPHRADARADDRAGRQ